MSRDRTLTLRLAGLLTAGLLGLTACAGENAAPSAGSTSAAGQAAGDSDRLTIDFATYNPLSLVIKEKGWLEEELKDDGVTVEWVQSAGSNKANEGLRSGSLDVGSTAGSAALLNRANGAPIKTIVVANQPEWAALVTTADSGITSVDDLAGHAVAATKGTDPYFFLVQSLDEAGVDPSSVTIQNLQHADGRAALENGSVDAWAGLDPIMAGAEAKGAVLFQRDPELNSYGFVNATEDFVKESPDTAQAVADAYEKARAWADENPEETAAILADVAGIDEAVASTVINERTNLDVSPVPGADQRTVLERIGKIFVETGDVAGQDQVDDALESLFEPSFAEKAESR
ncbi:aliphatic sulfonate ABC transporter substrate-binding protein [Micrococcus sp. EYE_162]|uniref:aliphatic sulfonate ABC transporter substrate-binding protein n=1 Tax=unclassified Micrococcus TaxID=2620948 RepID=UPI002006942E|nr:MULTISPECIES: aliphatic sulfonate ABC transporter substrate-binding protein [unclassified Micrococcus]MCK6095425.1 aliphatic sulfonate ABC transporter substrate-binding protein [Micrococcus sp. EYE_212]MCK6171500.1 aliphatic sulfonate ABC transporter substrate-binding protein [Micrococcus sp. EYE_162]